MMLKLIVLGVLSNVLNVKQRSMRLRGLLVMVSALQNLNLMPGILVLVKKSNVVYFVCLTPRRCMITYSRSFFLW